MQDYLGGKASATFQYFERGRCRGNLCEGHVGFLWWSMIDSQLGIGIEFEIPWSGNHRFGQVWWFWRCLPPTYCVVPTAQQLGEGWCIYFAFLQIFNQLTFLFSSRTQGIFIRGFGHGLIPIWCVSCIVEAVGSVSPIPQAVYIFVNRILQFESIVIPCSCWFNGSCSILFTKMDVYI